MKRFLLLVLLVCTGATLHAEPKDTCRVGMFVLSLYDLDFPNDAFTGDFWVWFLYPNDSLKPLESVEIANAKEYKFQLPDVEKKGNLNWATMKCKAIIRQNWDITEFPFDMQKINIILESADSDTSELIYLPDTANSALDSSVRLEGWSIERFTMSKSIRTYRTTYGDPELKSSSSYSLVVATIEMKRNGLRLFLKSFTGVYVAFLIAILGFFIDPLDGDPRFGLSVGALFATVGNKYIVDGILPESTTFTLVDYIHMLTFVYILLTVVISVITVHYSKRGDTALARRIDRYSFYGLCISYALCNLYLVLRTVL